MSRKPKIRKTAEQIAAELMERRRQDFAAVNMQPEAAGLPAFADVETERQNRKAAANRAWRSNVFRLLLERGTITPSQHEAAYQLIDDWAAWKGLDGGASVFGQAVDGGRGCSELVTDRMIKAGKRVYHALGSMRPSSAVILRAFMVATVEEDRAMAWRGIMQRVGITSRDLQTRYFVAAVEELRSHYQEPGRAAA
jgi:hypothetical protein